MPGRSGGQTRSPPHTRRRPAAGSFGRETNAAGDPRGEGQARLGPRLPEGGGAFWGGASGGGPARSGGL